MGMAVPYPESCSFWVSSLVKGLNHTRDGIPVIHPQRPAHQYISLLWHLASWTEESLVLLKDISCLYSLDHSQVWFWVLKPCCYFLIWWWLGKLNRFNSFPSCYFIQVFSAYPIWHFPVTWKHERTASIHSYQNHRQTHPWPVKHTTLLVLVP